MTFDYVSGISHKDGKFIPVTLPANKRVRIKTDAQVHRRQHVRSWAPSSLGNLHPPGGIPILQGNLHPPGEISILLGKSPSSWGISILLGESPSSSGESPSSSGESPSSWWNLGNPYPPGGITIFLGNNALLPYN